MRETGYPIGTQCVVTYVPPNYGGAPVSMGEVVAISSTAFIWWGGDTAIVNGGESLMDRPESVCLNGHLVQRVKPGPEENTFYVWPVYWMRQIDEDTDESDRETISRFIERPVIA